MAFFTSSSLAATFKSCAALIAACCASPSLRMLASASLWTCSAPLSILAFIRSASRRAAARAVSVFSNSGAAFSRDSWTFLSRCSGVRLVSRAISISRPIILAVVPRSSKNPVVCASALSHSEAPQLIALLIARTPSLTKRSRPCHAWENVIFSPVQKLLQRLSNPSMPAIHSAFSSSHSTFAAAARSPLASALPMAPNAALHSLARDVNPSPIHWRTASMAPDAFRMNAARATNAVMTKPTGDSTNPRTATSPLRTE